MSQTVLNYFPASKRCCYCISLKVGTVFIAVAGLIPSVVLVMLYGIGVTAFENIGVGKEEADAIVHIYAVLGILLCTIHVILLVAAFTYNEKLILLYLWTCIVYVFIDIVIVMFVTISAFLVRNKMFASLYMLCQVVYWLFILLFVLPVVNGFRRNIHTVVIIIS